VTPTSSQARAAADLVTERCAECEAYLSENRDALLHAAASVGIEHGLSTIQALRSYFRDFHATGHKPVTRPPVADFCACGTPLHTCSCGDSRCETCDPGDCSDPKPLDPVCAFHGKRASEHFCLYCCLCFETLAPEQAQRYSRHLPHP